jgi:hypothetical protein
MWFSISQASAQEWCQICLPCRLKRSPFDFNNDAHITISKSMHELACNQILCEQVVECMIGVLCWNRLSLKVCLTYKESRSTFSMNLGMWLDLD